MDLFIIRRGGNANSCIPEFYYTGEYMILNDGDRNWRIKFLTSGTFICYKTINIDVFLVGGGGGGGKSAQQYHGGGGGGGGYTTTASIKIKKDTQYDIVIGAGGASANNGSPSTAFGFTAEGGQRGFTIEATNAQSGGNGGSGGGGKSRFGANGKGGSNGSNGINGGGSSEIGYGGTGQGTTTREFGESSGDLYSGGGGAGARTASGDSAAAAAGGDGGGGAGSSNGVGSNGIPNTGGGGGGGANAGNGGIGGSGIVIIRNFRQK